MARKDTELQGNTLRLPEQHVREGRGVAGYQQADDGFKVEIAPTADPFEGQRSKTKVVTDVSEATEVKEKEPGENK